MGDPFEGTRHPRYPFQHIIEAGPRTRINPILVIGDRELDNVAAIIDHANKYKTDFEFCGLIMPGGEADPDILTLGDRVKDMRERGVAIPIVEEGGTTGFHFLSPEAEFKFEHAPYASEKLRGEDKQAIADYRKQYCEKLIALAKGMDPKLIFLSNFKVILDPVFVKAFKGKIVNVHPSILPLLKGFRPEMRALSGEDPQANGYTMHLVDTDLDGGPTLFQQQVPLEEHSSEEETRLGAKEYRNQQEERHRLKIIQAQANFSPRVLALVASNTPRKIVSGRSAFAKEGRPGFEKSEEYKKLLEQEYDEWKVSGGDESVPFKEWKKTHKPYRRVLFKKGEKWLTAEAILGADPVYKEKAPDVITKYEFTIQGTKPEIDAKWAQLFALGDKIWHDRGKVGNFNTKFEYRMGTPPFGIFSIEMAFDMKKEADELMQELGGVRLDIRVKPTRVLSPRVPIPKDGEI